MGIYWKVDNIRGGYKGAAWINWSINIIYDNSEEVHLECHGIHYNFPSGPVCYGYNQPIKAEKPKEIRFEVDTDAPESNKQNNVLTVKVEYGVTIYGKVYNIDLKGEKHPVKDGEIYCNSDISPLSFKYVDEQILQPDGNYSVAAPKKTGAPPFSYTLHAHTGYFRLRTRIKKTPKLDEFEYAEIDFIFGFSGRSVNPVERFLQRAPNLFPIL